MTYSDFIVLLARQRSGTNPMRAVLESHRHVFCMPEVFELVPTTGEFELAESGAPSGQVSYVTFIDKLFGGDLPKVLRLESHEEPFLDFLEYLRCFTDKKYVLVDVKYNSTHHVSKAWRSINEEPLLFEVIRNHGMRVLHLTRRNYLRYRLSELKAYRSRVWQAPDPTVAAGEEWYRREVEAGRAVPAVTDEKLYLDPKSLLTHLEARRTETEMVEHSFAQYDHYLCLDYDELFEELNGPMAFEPLERIARWLDIAIEFPDRRPLFKKLSALPLAETIENYSEVAAALTGTDFAYCLGDEGMYRPGPRQDARSRAAVEGSRRP